MNGVPRLTPEHPAYASAFLFPAYAVYCLTVSFAFMPSARCGVQ